VQINNFDTGLRGCSCMRVGDSCKPRGARSTPRQEPSSRKAVMTRRFPKNVGLGPHPGNRSKNTWVGFWGRTASRPQDFSGSGRAILFRRHATSTWTRGRGDFPVACQCCGRMGRQATACMEARLGYSEAQQLQSAVMVHLTRANICRVRVLECSVLGRRDLAYSRPGTEDAGPATRGIPPQDYHQRQNNCCRRDG
jgi:hypothetical protein